MPSDGSQSRETSNCMAGTGWNAGTSSTEWMKTSVLTTRATILIARSARPGMKASTSAPRVGMRTRPASRRPQQVAEPRDRAAQDGQGVRAHQPRLDHAHAARGGGGDGGDDVDGGVDHAHVQPAPEDLLAPFDDHAGSDPVVEAV